MLGERRLQVSNPPFDRQQRIANWLRRRNLTRFELGCIALWHLAIGVTIAFAPRQQVITPGTRAIFGTIHPFVWVGLFLTAGIFASLATIACTPLRLWMTWCLVFPIGVAWIYGFAVSVPAGHGNAIFALLWPALLVWWAITAIRLYLGGQGTRWNGS